MKRNSFIRACAGAIVFLVAPVISFAQKLSGGKGFFVGNMKDRFNKPTRAFNGEMFYTKVSTQDTDGGLYIFESTREKPGGPPLHFHYDQDEWWYIISGEFLIKVGDETFTAKAGDSVFGPRKVPHSFAKTGEGTGRLLMLFQPAGKMEVFFKAISEGKLAKMTMSEQDEFRKAHGFEHIGPPLLQ